MDVITFDNIQSMMNRFRFTSHGTILQTNLKEYHDETSVNERPYHDAEVLTTIAKNASNPTTIRCAVIYNDTSTSDDIYKVVDLTSDGSTAIIVVSNDFDYAVNAGGSLTGTVV